MCLSSFGSHSMLIFLVSNVKSNLQTGSDFFLSADDKKPTPRNEDGRRVVGRFKLLRFFRIHVWLSVGVINKKLPNNFLYIDARWMLTMDSFYFIFSLNAQYITSANFARAVFKILPNKSLLFKCNLVFKKLFFADSGRALSSTLKKVSWNFEVAALELPIPTKFHTKTQ